MKATVSQYAKALLELTGGKTDQEVSGIVAAFTAQLNRDGQLKNASKIMEKFSELFDAHHGIVTAEVVSVHEIGKEESEEVKKYIAEKYSAKEVVIKSRIDTSIKGGIVIRVGDEVLDGSVATQLKKLKRSLSN